MSKSKSNISRRDLIKFGGLTALGAASVGALSACSPQENSSGSNTTSSNANATEGGSGATPENRWQTQAAADWRAEPAPIDEAQITDGGTFDIVVVGGGQAGTWTARSASMNGAKVCVLEALEEEAFMYVGGEVAVINSQWAIEHGGDAIEPTEFMNTWLQRNASRTNQLLARNFVNESGRIMDWSISEINEVDPDFYNNTDRVNIYSADSDDRMVMDPSGYEFYKSTIVHRPVTGGGGDWEWGKVVMTHHRNTAIEEGATWNFNHYAQYLEKDDSGRVVSVIAKNQADESYIRFTGTRAIVLTAGDFANDVDMVRDINDEYRHLAEAYGNIELAAAMGMMNVRDGMGIKMGIWAGGHVEVGPRTGMNTGQAGLENTPWGSGFMLLNQRGNRFCNECAGGTEGSGYMASRQPRGAIVSIADANYLETVYRMPPAHGAVNLTADVTFNGIDPLKETMAALDPNSTEAQNGIYCANSFEELLDKLGCFDADQKANAIDQLNKWNEYAASGTDVDFGIDPRIMQPLATAPFYATLSQSDELAVGLCQTTGLDTDFNGCVLNEDLMPIPGLYAAGNDSGNRYIVNYTSPISGMSLGFCMTEGYLLGERLATTSAEETEK